MFKGTSSYEGGRSLFKNFKYLFALNRWSSTQGSQKSVTYQAGTCPIKYLVIASMKFCFKNTNFNALVQEH